LQRRIERGLSAEDMEKAILEGEIIEEYADDNPYPSCLINGFIKVKLPLHIVCALADRVKIITIYIPKEDEWNEYRTRRK